MYVPVNRISRLYFLDIPQQSRAATFEPARHNVVANLWYRGRNMGAQHINLTQLVDFALEIFVANLEWRSIRSL